MGRRDKAKRGAGRTCPISWPAKWEAKRVREDRTGWEIVWDGTDRGLLGRSLLPPRDSNPSEVWVSKSVRKYTKTGRHSKTAISQAEVKEDE